jgi:ubiquinone/menaquinone biosynthesis C-methylase UbiE
MTQTQPQAPTWSSVLPLLQCVACGGPIETRGEEGFACGQCGRAYPMREGFLDTMGDLDGNNKVAADFYDGPLWPKFRFWEHFTFFFQGGARRARRKVMKHLPNLSGTRLLEVAIGDGSNMPLIPPDCEVFGNDISIAQLRDCRRKHGDRNVRLLLGEAEALPFHDNTFDNVLSFGAFNYFSDPVKSLREMARVVKPEGLIVVSDEYPSLPNRMIFHKIGLPGVDRWILSRFMRLGDKFTDMVDKYRDMKLEPIFAEALVDFQIHPVWCKVGYVAVGRPKK